MSDTPRTDAESIHAQIDIGRVERVVPRDFARQLERELAAMTELAKRCYPNLQKSICSIHRDNGHYECMMCYPNWRTLVSEHAEVGRKLCDERDALREGVEKLADRMVHDAALSIKRISTLDYARELRALLK